MVIGHKIVDQNIVKGRNERIPVPNCFSPSHRAQSQQRQLGVSRENATEVFSIVFVIKRGLPPRCNAVVDRLLLSVARLDNCRRHNSLDCVAFFALFVRLGKPFFINRLRKRRLPFANIFAMACRSGGPKDLILSMVIWAISCKRCFSCPSFSPLIVFFYIPR